MEDLFGHTWCDCLECDQRIASFRLLLVGRANRDDDLMLVLTHNIYEEMFNNTTYLVFGEVYHLLSRFGEIQDPQLVDPDEDEDDDEDPYDRI